MIIYYELLLIVCMHFMLHESFNLIVIVWVGVARHAQTCLKCANIRNFRYLYNGLSYCFKFMHVYKVPWEPQINLNILGGRDQACTSMPKVCLEEIFSIQYPVMLCSCYIWYWRGGGTTKNLCKTNNGTF